MVLLSNYVEAAPFYTSSLAFQGPPPEEAVAPAIRFKQYY